MPRLAPAPRRSSRSRLGLLHTLSPAPFYIAQERGYFRDEGIDLTFRFFEAAQPIAAAAVAGDIDVGVTALTGGFFNLAEKGTLKVIGGAMHEEKGYEGSADHRFEQGVRRRPDHACANWPAIASPSRNTARRSTTCSAASPRSEHFDMKSVELRPVQQVPNMLAAVESGQVDATIAIASQAKPLAAAGKAHIIGWVGDHRAVPDHRGVHHATG